MTNACVDSISVVLNLLRDDTHVDSEKNGDTTRISKLKTNAKLHVPKYKVWNYDGTPEDIHNT